ncbi:tetratricopeptide repeat protein [Aestuariimicrobium ganziense]|uniref:hypothetical protein n=1 Tax=Aestuariimicrobium ganziense TaxID=2773677 RepID=UPI00194137DD|nr:hypothetical protein [Aestuariimicrobium ganziense]
MQRPGLAPKANEPETPVEYDEKALPRAVRAELRGLPVDLARIVGAHLWAAGEALDSDPELALAHAQAARRRAARLPVVREATAETAHAAGEWAVALTEYRALHRMTGSPDYLPVMADCERALGRPREALKLAKQAGERGLSPEQWLEMVIVEAGARADLGQADEGVRVLKQAISSRRGPKLSQARLRYALADLAIQDGDTDLAGRMFAEADRLDTDHDLDADERLAELEGRPVVPREDEDVALVQWGIPEQDDDEDEGDEASADAEAQDSGEEEQP